MDRTDAPTRRPAGVPEAASSEPSEAPGAHLPAAAEPSPRSTSDRGRPDLTIGEAAGVALAVSVALIATASLALAQLGAHDGRLAVLLGLAGTVLLAIPAWRVGPRPKVRVDRLELLVVGLAGLAASFFFLPGFPYASVDKDPGVYVAHAFAIARGGDVVVPAPVLEAGLDPRFGPSGLFPGFWVEAENPEAVTPQFYHLYPATLATAHDLAGSKGVFHLTPLLGIASVCLLVVAVRRATTTAAAVVFAALFVTSMMQVWQSRYPSTEGMAQFFLAGALLGGVLAVDRRWAGGALAAGVLLGVGFLCRPDGFLYILLAAAVVGLAVAADRVDRRVAMLGAGLALTFPYAAWNAYEARATYSASNSVPSLATLVGACVVIVAAGIPVRALAGLVDRWRRRRHAAAYDGDAAGDGSGATDDPGGLLGILRRWRVPLGVLASAGAALVLIGLWNRERLLGTDYVFSHFQNKEIRSLDEINIKWLSWFVSMRGLVVMWLGVVVAALTRVKAAAYLLVLPGAVLLPVYLWDARISMRLMWWVRRFTPAVLPAVLLLIALAVAWALLHRYRPVRVLGALAAASLVASFATQSLWLRGHGEMAGSWEVARDTSAFAGDEQGVFLYTASRGTEDPIRNTPGAVWFIFDEIAARLQPTFDMAEIEGYQQAFPDQPVFLVTHGSLPPQLPADRFALAGEVVQRMVMWEETQDHVPDHAVGVNDEVMVWRVLDAPAAAVS